MRKSGLFRFMYFAVAIILGLAITTTSCKKDDPDPEPEIILDGVYIKGAATALIDFDKKGMMNITRNEVVQEDRASLLDIYVAVKAGSEGFNLVTVKGSEITTYGPGDDFAEVTELDNDEPKDGLWRGSIKVTETPFTVSEDALYHIAYDTEVGIVTLAKVEWGAIGAATPGGWGESTQFPSTGFDLNTITFTKTDVKMIKGDFKFRFSNGWKIILDADYDLGDGNTGIKVNTNYGETVDNLIPGGANIVNDAPGFYTITMVWTLGEAVTATLEKTSDLELVDYSATELGLVGDAVVVGGEPVGWELTVLNHVPVVTDETTYTWTYEGVEFSTEGSFKIREGQDWNGKVVGYPDVVMGGTAAGDFETNDDGNFVPTVNGVYDVTFSINALTEIYTFDVKSAGAADPELYLLGDGCAAGWDNTTAIPLNGTGGEYTLTADLTGGGYLKFITTLGQWAPMYGTDDSGTAAAGTLVFRETESDPDPASIPVDADGSYVITVNTNDMTYTVVAAK